MSKTVDARNLNCPQPVILTKRAMEESEGEKLITIVNQKVAMENVSKLAASQGYEYEVEQKGEEYYIYMTKSCDAAAEKAAEEGDTAVLITSRLFGQGTEELGEILMKSFLYTLTEMKGEIKHIILMNSGVFLSCEGSPVLEHLKVMEEEGVEVLSCGTCLDFYQLKEKLAVGKVTNMYTAVETLNSARKSITL